MLEVDHQFLHQYPHEREISMMNKTTQQKVIVRNLSACAALAFALSPHVATAGLIQTADDFSSTSQSTYAGTVLSDDLINTGTATLLSTTVANYTATESALNPGTPDFVLNDGSNGGDTTGGNLSNGAAADSDSDFQVTYNLDLTTNTAGYDLTRIRSYTAAANNRTAQEYEVLVDFVGDGLGNFVSLGTFSTLNHEAGNTNQSTRMTLENDVNSGVDAFASGVAAIRFDAGAVGNYPAWREFDVEGSAVNVIPEPCTLMITLLSFVGLVARRRRRTNRA